MKNKFLKFASSLLAFLFLFSQNTILAEGFLDFLFGNNSQTQAVDDTLHVLGEVESKRSEYTKHFRMSDGSMKAIRYSDQVHYKDGECFKEIDNSLISEGNDAYKNTDSPLSINISKNFKNKNLITLNSDDHEISLSYIKKKYKKFDTEQIQKPIDRSVVKDEYVEVCNEDEFSDKEEPDGTAQGESSEPEQELQTTSSSPAIDTPVPEMLSRKVTKSLTQADIDAIPEFEQGANSVQIENLKDKIIDDRDLQKINANKVYSTAVYSSPDQGMDLRYALAGLMFKENIVLNNKSDDNDRFDFECRTSLSISKSDNGNLVFSDGSGKAVFVMPKGVMWDANDSASNEVEYEFTPINGGYIISIVPNRDWIDDDSRVYPIIIDPSITTADPSIPEELRTGITTTQCSSSNPTTSYASHAHITVGALSPADQWLGYVKLNSLPNFSHGEIITSAKLCLCPYPGSGNSYVTSPDNALGVKKVTGAWSGNTTWNTKPLTENAFQDYYRSSSSTLGDYNTWDITKIVKDWYALDNPNVNDGIELSTTNIGNISLLRYVSVYDTVNQDKKPYFEVNYREFIGEEEYWSYKSHSAGYKGVGNANIYAGTLSVAENVLSYSGSRNPVSISNTYNNVNYNEQANSYFHTKEISGGYSRSSFSGLGFRFSFDKIVYPIPSDDYMYSHGDWRYIYIDGDGTQHYFKLDNNKIIDADGLGLTLTETTEDSQPIIEISDLQDNKLTFNNPDSEHGIYVLKSQSDNKGNITTYAYSDGKITGITDAAGRSTAITYINGTNKVSKITAADGKEVNFSYDGERLKEIFYPENMKTSYEYDHQGRLCLVSTNEGSGRSVKYEYASNDKDSLNFFKVRSVTEYGSQNASEKTKGASQEFWYDMNQTKITSKINNLDVPYHENTEIYQFDNEGRATGIIDGNGNFHETEYYKEDEETPRKKHKIKENAMGQKIVHNLLKNSRAANLDTAGWEIENWNPNHQSSENCCSITASNEEANLGSGSFKVNISQNHESWPVAKQIVSVPVSSEDQKYTFSADVKINGGLVGGEGASIHIGVFKDQVQTSGDNYSRWLKSTDNEWKRISVTVNVPAGSNNVRCYFGMKNSSGSAYFDCLQLEKGDTANSYNMVECSDFKENTGVWIENNLNSSTDVITEKGMRITGNTESSKNICQRIDVNRKNPTFNVAVKAEAKSSPKKGLINSTNTKNGFFVEFEINYSDGTTQKRVDDYFNQSIYDDQYYFNSISSQEYVESGNNLILPDREVSYVRVFICYNYNCNEAYIKEAQVTIEEDSNMYHYNENGVSDRLKNKLGNDNKIEYTTANEIKKSIRNVDINTTEEIENTYNNSDAGHNLEFQTREFGNNKKSKNNYTYDSVGNVLTSELSSVDTPNAKKIHTENTYQENQNYPQTSKDAKDKVTTYNYNSDNGNLQSVTNACGTQLNYSYDNDGKLTNETCGNLQNSYSYVNGLLDSINHKVSESLQTTYKFIRNIFGNITETKVGNRTLSKRTYDAGGGLLRQVKYGNEQTVNYDYDEKGRLIRKSFGYGKGDKFGEITYTYDSKNRIVETYDSLGDLTTKFEYDRFGRIERIERSDGVVNDLSYDNFRNLVSKSVLNLFGVSQTLENTFGKSDMLSSSSIQTGNITILSKYGYDDIARLQNSDVLTSDESSGIRHEISYEDFGQDRTTGLVSSIEIKKKVSDNWTSTGEKFNYTYDDLGNITAITDASNSLIASYVYNNLNELIRENNVQTGKTVAYTYNAGGNMTEKKIYSYTIDADLTNATLESTVTYNYGDANWPDKLTSITCGEDEQAIIYDAIGNPLEYRNGWNFSWVRGHRLDKMENSGYNINIEFKYNERGVRTQKIVNGVQTDFITSGIKLLGQKTGENVLLWQVDGNGNTIGFNYNNIPYFYMKNLQGDIVGITDASGNIVAKYTYDSWGKLISIKDASDVDKTTDTTFIGYINPLRYKGYYYDSETSLYYLNARYYDPEVGRFISADETLDGGYNLFEYCYNNPINFADYTGKAPYDLFDTMDAAAIDWAYFYHPQAIKAGREYASHIFMTNYGKYYYRDAIIGEEESVDVPIEPLSVGWVHSHQNSSWVKANIFASDADIDISESRNIIGYVVTPAGDIQRYKPLGDYGRAVDPRGNVGTLTWIHYDWWGLGGSNGWKFFWNKNALDRRLDELRGTLGSIQGPQYGATWNLVHG